MTKRADDFRVFWGEMSPSEHFVQIYEHETVLLDTLEGFVTGGLRNGESVIVIATEAHRAALDRRVRAQGFNVDAALAQDQYIVADASDTLSRFMRDGWPDDALFAEAVQGLLQRTVPRGRPVRAFGEMVALLWAQGHNGATVHLEHLWHHLCASESFSLFCAYPRSGFTRDSAASIQEICEAHTKVLAQIH
jgi:hypothetical protein